MADTTGFIPNQYADVAAEAAASVPGDKGTDTLAELEKDFERLKQQKARPSGGVEGSTLTNLCFLHDEQYVDYKQRTLSLEAVDANKPNLTFNLIGPRFNKWMGRMSAFNAPFKARANRKDPQALEESEIVDRAITFLDEKVDETSRMRERLYWIGAGGVAFEYIPWVPNSTIEPTPQFDGSELLYKWAQDESQPVSESTMQQLVMSQQAAPEEFEVWEEIETVGEVGSIILGPFNVFIDASVRSVSDLAPDQWVHIAEIKTVGWIEENYGEKVEAQSELSLIVSRINANVGEATGGVYLKDLIPLVQGSADENDPEMVLHVSSYQPASSKHPHGRYVCWIPKQKVLKDQDNPYEEIPLVDFHFGPVTTNFWTKSYISPLIAPQRFINKRMNQLAEQANTVLGSPMLLGPGINKSDIAADRMAPVTNGMSETGVPLIGRVPPPEIPPWFLQSIELGIKMFNDASGGGDLMEDNKFPGQLRGPLAVPMLQEILDTQWGPLFNHLGERLARVKQMRLNRIKQFYPPIRTMHYTDRTQRDEVMTFHTDKILRSGTNFSITVERGSILPELRALRESRLRERLQSPLAILYMDERTGRLDKSKIAADLQFGDTGREGREAKYRKLGVERIKMLWDGKTIPPVQPFYDHKAMLDELEDAMATTEFMKASAKIQQLFGGEWAQHNQFMQAEAAAQQNAMQSHMIQTAVAQATQQAAATAAAQAVDAAMEQVHAQQALPTDQIVANAQARSGGGQQSSGPRRPLPPGMGGIPGQGQ